MALNFLNNGYFAGKVGIGVETPVEVLEVTGNTILGLGEDRPVKYDAGAGNFRITPNSGGYSTGYFFNISDGTFKGGFGALGGTGSLSYFWIGDDYNDATMVIQPNAGNVGIGTTSPGYKLDIESSDWIQARFSSTSSGYAPASILLESADSDSRGQGVYQYNSVSKNSWFSGVPYSTTSDDWVIAHKLETTAFNADVAQMSNALLCVNDNGNVGIGTTSPERKLHVFAGESNGAASNAQSTLVLENSTNTYLQFLTPASSESGILFGDTDNDRGALTYSHSSDAMNFRVAAETKMYINSSGNVGIGTTSPSAKLDVQSSTTGNLLARVYNPNTGTSSSAAFRIASGANNANSASLQFSDASAYTATISGDRVQGLVFRTSASGSNPITIPERMRITPTGNVGIGTTSPTAPLDVFGVRAGRDWSINNRATIRLDANGTGYPSDILFGHTAAANQTSWTGAYWSLSSRGSSASNKFYFYRASGNPTGSAEAILMTFDPNLRVGINNSSPSATLDVNGGSDNLLATFKSTDDLAYISFQDNNTTSNTSVALGANDNNLVFFTGTTFGSERMRITSAGNVGIGTTTPNVLGFLETGLNIAAGGSSSTTLQQAGLVISGSSDADDADDFGYLSFTNYQSTLSSDRVAEIRINKGGSNVNTGRFNFYTANGTALNESMVLGETGLLKLSQYGAGTLVTDASGNVTVSSGGGAGGPYLPLAGGTMTGVTQFNDHTQHGDQVQARWGASNDLTIEHNATDSSITNITGDLYITNKADGKDIVFRSDDGSGGFTPYLKVDSASQAVTFVKPAYFTDNVKALFGNSSDFQIYHDGSNSYIKDVGTGSLYVGTNSFRLTNAAGTENLISAFENDTVILYNNNIEKLRTTGPGVTVTGIASATTFSGDLNGTINTATTAVTQVDAVDNDTVATTAYVNNKIQLIPAGLVFQGTWNAATNTPTLTSGSGTTGNFYIVSTPGSTNLDGITDWKTGDWAVFIEQGVNDQWEKIDNSSVLDGFGTGGRVTKWSGSGTSNTLTDSGISDASNAIAITINGNEEVGIGGSPFHKLDVYGTLRVSGQVTFGDDLSVNDSARFEGTTNPITIGDGFGYGGSATICKHNHDIYLQYNNGQTATNVRFGGGGTSVNLLDAQSNNYNISGTGNSWFNGGNVGIGTSSPTSALSINKSMSAAFIADFVNPAVNGHGLLIQAGGTTGTRYITQWKDALGTERFHMEDNGEAYFQGNVGIGTTSPLFKLDVAGTANIDTYLVVPLIYSGGGNIVFGNVAQFNDWVGIGTTTPAYELDVDGTIRSDNFISGSSSSNDSLVLASENQHEKVWTTTCTFTYTGTGIYYFNLAFGDSGGFGFDLELVTGRNGNYRNFGKIKDSGYMYWETDGDFAHHAQGPLDVTSDYSGGEVSLDAIPTAYLSATKTATSYNGSSPWSYFIKRYAINLTSTLTGSNGFFKVLLKTTGFTGTEIRFLNQQ